MVKNKGFTLIELMIIIAIVGILLAVVIGSGRKIKNQSENSTETQYSEVLDAPIDYIRNDKRTSQTVKLTRHSDGTLWACNTQTKDCYMVDD